MPRSPPPAWTCEKEHADLRCHQSLPEITSAKPKTFSHVSELRYDHGGHHSCVASAFVAEAVPRRLGARQRARAGKSPSRLPTAALTERQELSPLSHPAIHRPRQLSCGAGCPKPSTETAGSVLTFFLRPSNNYSNSPAPRPDGTRDLPSRQLLT